MDKILENLMGITETKIFMVDTFIKMAKGQNGKIKLYQLELIRAELMKAFRDEDIDKLVGDVSQGETEHE